MAAETPEDVSFTYRGALVGARRIVPLALSTMIFGLAFGVAAREDGLSVAEAMLMSGLVWAGTSQFAALEVGTASLALLPMLAVTLAVNARYLLLSAALRPWLAPLPAAKSYGTLALMSDGNWALAMRERAEGRADAAFIVGSGALMYVAWLSGTGIGHLLGATLAEPERWGLDFAAIAFFVTILAATARGRADILPWAVAGAVATLTAVLVPGHWCVLAGGLAGSLAGALRDGA
jgi:4-azaleucine resistance transporter AzlC